MRRIPYDLTGPIGTTATLGLIVLQADETLEQDMRRLFTDPATAIHISRIPSGDTLTTDTIAAMKADLPAAARLLPRAAAFDAVGYGCTSGTTLIGADSVAALVRQGVAAPVVTDPLTAALAALRAFGLTRIGLVTPYVASVAAPVRDAFGAKGVTVTDAVSFGEQVEARVARIDPASIMKAARAVAPGAEAIFLSCTNLRTLDIIAPLEAELGLLVLSSNQVLAWHLARATGAPLAANAPGCLCRLPLA
ncbi:maleate cis-trans isomerase family protein [Loktanella sp. M215]|uniref:maleate cis-trans isomerase family protein n=1 Tax=Loktanella sp. M215 TaxID=2675431 RepID=UPI001F0070E5|nr:aspartate/glutamate racemase family protein [Loktanella sp. M215]MCF7701106.1 Asp/Glu racemase [Loktanella sp. M215]